MNPVLGRALRATAWVAAVAALVQSARRWSVRDDDLELSSAEGSLLFRRGAE